MSEQHKSIDHLTHLDEHGNIRMVDVTERPETVREACRQSQSTYGTTNGASDRNQPNFQGQCLRSGKNCRYHGRQANITTHPLMPSSPNDPC